MKKILPGFLILFCWQTLYGQKKNTTTIRIANRIEMTVPTSFSKSIPIANDSMYASLKHNSQPVLLAYQMHLSTHANPVEVSDNEIPAWTDKELSALKQSSDVTYLDDGIFLQDGKNIGYIKFKLDRKQPFDSYNLIFYVSVEGKVFIVHFSCPFKLRKKWEPIADEIANSLRVIPAE